MVCAFGLAAMRQTAFPQTHPAADPVGQWDGALTLDGLEHDLSIKIARADTLAGTIYDACWVTRDHVCAEGRSAALQEVRVVGDTLSFSIPQMNFTGVLSGNRMKATIVFKGDRTPHTFTAIRH